jgi:DNA-binding MarR family transcriptional regulator
MLRALVAALSQSARTVERRTGITNAQLFLLQQLQVAGTLSVNDLAELARTQQSTVSIVVGRLERDGLVGKVRSSIDARRAVVSLTPSGRRLLRNAPAPPTALLLRAVGELRHADACALALGLRALTRRLRLSAQPPSLLFEDAGRRGPRTPGP